MAGNFNFVFFLTGFQSTILELPHALWVNYNWIDQPEATFGLCLIGASLCFLRFLRADTIAVARRAFLGCCVFFQIGLFFKEHTYVVPIVTAMLLFYHVVYEREVFSVRRREGFALLVLVGLAIGNYAWRTYALSGPGFIFGTNGSAGFRLFQVFTGWPGTVLAMQNTIPLALVCTGFALICGFQRRWLVAFTLTALSAGLFLYAAKVLMKGFDDPFYVSLFQYRPYGMALETGLLLWLYWQVLKPKSPFLFDKMSLIQYLRERPKPLVFGLLWVLATYLPLLRQTTTSHTLFVVSAGWSLYVAAVVTDYGSTFAQAIKLSGKAESAPQTA